MRNSEHDSFVCFLGFVSVIMTLVIAPNYVFLACAFCGLTLGVLREKRNPPKDIMLCAIVSIGVACFGQVMLGIHLGNAGAIRFTCIMSLIFCAIGYGFGRMALGKKFKCAQIDRAIRRIDERYDALLEKVKSETDGWNISANEAQRRYLRHTRRRLVERRERHTAQIEIGI